MILRKAPALYADELRRLLAAESGYTPDELLDGGLKKTLTSWRILGYAVMREAGYSYPEIAGAWDRDHRTIIQTTAHLNGSTAEAQRLAQVMKERGW